MVRERAAGTLEYVVCKELGARDLAQHGGIPALLACLTDTQPCVQAAAYLALLEAAKTEIVRRELCNQVWAWYGAPHGAWAHASLFPHSMSQQS